MAGDQAGHAFRGCMGPVRGMKVEVDDSQVFTDYGAAVWACFRARWQEVTGKACPVA